MGLAALSLSTSGSLKDNQISQTSKVSDPNGLNLSASGTVGLAQPNALSLSLDGTIPTAALKRPLLEADIRAEGAISLKGSVSGSASSPAYQITATPAGLKVTSLSTGLTVQNIGGTAAVTQDQAVLERDHRRSGNRRNAVGGRYGRHEKWFSDRSFHQAQSGPLYRPGPGDRRSRRRPEYYRSSCLKPPARP